MDRKTVKIGMLGCSRITPFSILTPAKELPYIEAYGMAAQDVGRAKAYAEQHRIPRVFASYDELLQCEDIDMVYIPLSNFMHTEWTIKAAEAKKHVLIEKPISIKPEEVLEIGKASERNGVHILEAMMVQHHDWQHDVKAIIQSGKYGKLKKIKTRISFEIMASNYSPDNYRFKPEYGGGCFIDESSYWLQFIQRMLGLNPLSYEGRSDFAGYNGCDWTFHAQLNYPGDVEVEFLGSFEMPNNATHWLEFEDAEVKIHNFFKPCYGNYKIVVQIDNVKQGIKEKLEYAPQNYYVNQLDFFSSVIHGERNNIQLSESYERIKMMEMIYSSAHKSMQSEVTST
jgi:predicted dehydrogenase